MAIITLSKRVVPGSNPGRPAKSYNSLTKKMSVL